MNVLTMTYHLRRYSKQAVVDGVFTLSVHESGNEAEYFDIRFVGDVGPIKSVITHTVCGNSFDSLEVAEVYYPHRSYNILDQARKLINSWIINQLSCY